MKNLLLCLLAMIVLNSCCTTYYAAGLSKPADPITVTSNVDGAEVYINGKLAGNTPYTHWGKKADVKKILVKADGYYEMKQKTKRSIKGGAYWNFFPYPLINWIWGYFKDISNGTGRRYKQATYHFELKPIKQNENI